MIDGGGGGGPVRQSGESGLKHPDGWAVLVVELTKFVSSIGACTMALVLKPGSMDGPPGKQLASSGNCAT